MVASSVLPPEDDGVFAFSPVHRPVGRRSSDEPDRTVSARGHDWYQASAREDGLYHCPLEGQDQCQHRPETLRCNYQ